MVPTQDHGEAGAKMWWQLLGAQRDEEEAEESAQILGKA